MTIGIDKIGFATSQYVLRLSELAAARNTDPEKLSKGLLLKELSIAPITEDIVTLGASASDSILTEEEKIQLVKLTPEQQAQYIQQYNENSAATYEENLAKLGVIDKSKPAAIEFYTSSFQQKQELKDFINAYNTAKKDAGEDDKVLAYSDDIQTIMSSITTMVGVITTVLVGFVAISLIVSSIMIAIITYISVLERTKEIGILRAMGASKKDIRRIFTAETAIEGFISGVLGIAITLLATLPINAVVAKMTNVENVARLPWEAALILIGISIVLTMLAGLIPSRIAAKKDPVESLRSE